MTPGRSPEELVDLDVLDRHGERIGRVDRVFLDGGTQEPTFIAIHTGLLSRAPSIVPLAGAVRHGAALMLPLTRDRVKGAPTVHPAGSNGGLTLGQERALQTFYGLDATTDRPATQERRPPQPVPSTRPPAPPTPPIPPGPPAPSGPPEPVERDAMTRSEEQLKVGTENRPVMRARLRKHVVTEEVQVTVPVRHEEVRVEWEPVAPGEALAPGEAAPADETPPEDLTLHAERIVVQTENVPVERVRLAKTKVAGEEVVSGEVRREKIVVEDPTHPTEEQRP